MKYFCNCLGTRCFCAKNRSTQTVTFYAKLRHIGTGKFSGSDYWLYAYACSTNPAQFFTQQAPTRILLMPACKIGFIFPIVVQTSDIGCYFVLVGPYPKIRDNPRCGERCIERCGELVEPLVEMSVEPLVEPSNRLSN